VKVLRAEPSAGPAPALGLASLDRVLETARAAGVEVEAELSVPAESLPRPVDAAAYRIVQESMTNVLRHARATRVPVRAERTDGGLSLRISDDGRGRPAGMGRPIGTGISGMRERAELLGGTLTAGRGPDGFTVQAQLPARPEEETRARRSAWRSSTNSSSCARDCARSPNVTATYTGRGRRAAGRPGWSAH